MPTATIPGINAMMEGGTSEKGVHLEPSIRGAAEMEKIIFGLQMVSMTNMIGSAGIWVGGGRLVQSRRDSIGKAIKQRRTQHVMGIRGTTGRVP